MSRFKYNQRKIGNKLKNLRSIALILVITSIVPTIFLYIFIKEAPGFSTLLANYFKYDRSLFLPWINQLFIDFLPPRIQWIFIIFVNFIDLIIICNLICVLETMIYLYISQTIVEQEEIDETLYQTLNLSGYDMKSCDYSNCFGYSINGLDEVGYQIKDNKSHINSFNSVAEYPINLCGTNCLSPDDMEYRFEFILLELIFFNRNIYNQERYTYYKTPGNVLLLFNFVLPNFSMNIKFLRMISTTKSTLFVKVFLPYKSNIQFKILNTKKIKNNYKKV
ncbi:MAG: hypothetical protein GF317_17605 [Candidatus Lokiarchaeota archaeon]|nr:hypothetical protein [Candidatus Lokiarchaeota archaeon]MBD3201335.1 hypothetical protein [Candidatus Lokiarchaeota archaeon]